MVQVKITAHDKDGRLLLNLVTYLSDENKDEELRKLILDLKQLKQKNGNAEATLLADYLFRVNGEIYEEK